MSLLRGRFDGAVAELMTRFSSSLEVDLKMAREDLEGSRAHVSMLQAVGLLSSEEAKILASGLETIQGEVDRGEFRPSAEQEDIHMAVESRLKVLVGEVAGKLHTARSRNDQVATDLRLWTKKHLSFLGEHLETLIRTLLGFAEEQGKVMMPGYTHLQRGQPIWLGHQILAHTWPLWRDLGRLRDAQARMDESPLGACAMAGTPLPIDRRRTAASLGFKRPVPNAMDAVAARDHLQETAAFCCILMSHLSRQCEELILWSSAEWNFARLGDAWATGSSIMPQKRNPDAPELVRGMTGRVYGHLQALLVLTKGLPLAYNRDLQEDRTSFFECVEVTGLCLEVMNGVWQSLEIHESRFEDEMVGDFSLATELADALVSQGIHFREAHEVVGRIVTHCDKKGQGLNHLSLEDYRSFHSSFPADLNRWLDPLKAIERRNSEGGTAWICIEKQIQSLREELG